MLSAGVPFFISLTAFLVLALFTSWEMKREGGRVILAGLRAKIDSILVAITAYLRRKIHYLVRHTIKLSWYYSIHSMLATAMGLLVKAYDRLEAVLVENRGRARKLRAEKKAMSSANHLTVMAEHMASNALTPSQKKKLRARKLEKD